MISSTPTPAHEDVSPTGPTAAQIRELLRKQMVPPGKGARIRALRKHGYRLALRALVAGRVKIRWYRARKGARPLLIANGRRSYDAAGRAVVRMRLTKAGRRQLRHARRLRLTAKGTFTPVAGAPISAARRFTLRR
jgi:hypothetical protein